MIRGKHGRQLNRAILNLLFPRHPLKEYRKPVIYFWYGTTTMNRKEMAVNEPHIIWPFPKMRVYPGKK